MNLQNSSHDDSEMWLNSGVKILSAKVIFVFVLGLSSTLQAQIEFYRPSPFVVWLQHSDDYENTCILVRPDASYHLERSENHRQVVYAGLLSPDELQALHAMLDDPDFASIDEADIKNALMTSTRDPYSIMIPRKGKYQRLTFVDADSRKPFRKTVDPLLTWFLRMKKDKRSIPSSEEVNGCMPDPAADTAPVPAQVATTKNTDPEPPAASIGSNRVAGFGFMVRFVVDAFSNGDAKATCISVYPNGTFRIEDATQHLFDSKHVQVYEGSLKQDQVKELRQLLDSPDLVHVVHRNTASNIAVYEGEQVQVAIPRDTYVQNLIYTDYFGASHHWSYKDVPGGSSQVDSENRVIKPLREWIRNKVEKNKGKPMKEEAANGCIKLSMENGQ